MHFTSGAPFTIRLPSSIRFVLIGCAACLFIGGSCATSTAQAPSDASASVSVADMLCEHLREPLGIDVRRPRVSWRLAPTDASRRGQRQTAYRVLVANSPDTLDEARGACWDSGKVESSQSVLIEYAGEPLEPDREYFWKVRVWDKEGETSRWSDTARWTTGPLEASDWRAKWIGAAAVAEPSGDGRAWDPWLRRELELESAPRRAEMHVASVGYHELYVNGHKASDAVLAPAVANHRVRARWVTYDVAPLLRPGTNVVALWLGTSWSIYPNYQTPDKPSAPIVTARARIEGADGAVTRLVTDERWRTCPSPNRLLGSWNFRDFGGELYDARREQPGWNARSFNDDHWSPAAVYEPKLKLSAEMLEPNRVVKEIPAVSVEETDEGVYRVDMGVNFAGLIEVDITGEPGARIEIQSSELADQPMTNGLRSVYIVGQRGRGTFRSRFNYHSGRWLTIKGLARRPLPSEVRGYHVRTDFARTGQFACSNDLINRVYETTLWTFENLAIGGYLVDCPQRERMGYGGDAHATLPTGLSNYGLAPFYAKWLQDWRDVQFDDGFVPFTAPTYWGGGGPAWSGFCVTLPWEMYRQYGDQRVLVESWPTIERWLAFLDAHTASDLLVRWGGREGCADDQWSFLGDWLWPGATGTNSHTRETHFLNNCYWVFNLQTAASIADVLGERDDAARYRQRAEQVRAAAHQEYFDPEAHSYVNGDQAYLAIALLTGVPPGGERERVWRRLEDDILVRRDGHIHAGITGGAMLFKLLMEHSRDELIYPMVDTREYPGWGDMLRRGATTIWESWDADSRPDLSRLHSSYLYVGAWPIHDLAGIRPGAQGGGFQSFVIKPALLKDAPLAWRTGRYECDYGVIESSLRREERGLRMQVTVPPNTSATVFVPAGRIDAVTESGRPLIDAPGVSEVRQSAGRVEVRLEPGQYDFLAQE